MKTVYARQATKAGAGDEMDEIFEVFNERNEVVGTAPRSEVHAKGLYHRAAIVFVYNRRGEVFLQRRSAAKDTNPGCWDYSVGEHCKPGESYEEAARRGLEEELGLATASLRLVRGPHLNCILHEDGKMDNEFDAVYAVQAEGPFSFPDCEAAEGTFVTPAAVDKEIAKGRRFTPFFLSEWPSFKEMMLHAP